jgi:hypothetical protein
MKRSAIMLLVMSLVRTSRGNQILCNNRTWNKQASASATGSGRFSVYAKSPGSLIEGRSLSQKADTRDDFRDGQSCQGPPAGHDIFRCPSVVNPARSGMRNRSMSPTTCFSGTVSM